MPDPSAEVAISAYTPASDTPIVGDRLSAHLIPRVGFNPLVLIPGLSASLTTKPILRPGQVRVSEMLHRYRRGNAQPSGSVSKLFGLTEGWHVPAMAFYMRWVQFRSDDPQLQAYRDNGYPVRDLQSYAGHTIVGFPTAPTIASMEDIEDHLVLAGDASMEDQFEWLRLGEQFWLEGHDVQSYRAGMKTLPDYGNQISYTLKYKPEVTGFDLFKQMLLDQQSTVRCCSVMPQEDGSSYEYLPPG